MGWKGKAAITEAVSIHFDEALLYGELIIYHFEFCGEGLRNICSEMIFVPQSFQSQLGCQIKYMTLSYTH